MKYKNLTKLEATIDGKQVPHEVEV